MTSTEERNKAIVVRYNKEFIENGDMALFEETIAHDFVNRTPNPGTAADRSGVAYFFNEVLRPAFPDLVVTIHDQTAEATQCGPASPTAPPTKARSWV